MQILNAFELTNVAGGGSNCLCFNKNSIYNDKYTVENKGDAPNCAYYCCGDNYYRCDGGGNVLNNKGDVLWTWFGEKYVVHGDCLTGSVSVMS